MYSHIKLFRNEVEFQKKAKSKDKEREHKRAILLSSNKEEPFQWPRVFSHGIHSAGFLANNSIYTTPKRKTVLRRNKRKRLAEKTPCNSRNKYPSNHFSLVFGDPFENKILEDAKDQVLEHALDSTIEEIKPIDCDESQGTDSLAVRHLTVEMIEQLFQNMANAYQEQRTADYNWKYLLGKAIETGLPAPVIERVRQRMTKMTKKESQAIAALNVPKHDAFVDLTEPISEAEVKTIVLDISSNKECPLTTSEDDEEQEMFKRYIALTQGSDNLSSRVQSIHDYYNQQVFKTESRYDF